MSKCFTRDHLEQYLDGRLKPDGIDVVLEHVNNCQSCQETLNELTEFEDLDSYRISSLNSAHDCSTEKQIAVLSEQPPIFEPKSSQIEPINLDFLDPPGCSGDLGSLLHYRVKRIIGSGGMGMVFEGYDTSLERHIAIKVFKQSSKVDSRHDRFFREARAVAGLKNDHIVPIHSIHADDVSNPFMVMELVNGNSLEKELKSPNSFSPIRAARICLQVTKGLKAAHETGIIHRDVKPSNVLLDSVAQRARITDFGLARFTDQVESITQDGTILGTPAYMSPEQLLNGGSADCRSDIYSLGVTLFEMLTGRVPFQGGLQIMARQIQLDSPPLVRSINPKVPRDLETIVAKCIEKEPKRRYQTAADLTEDLTRFLDGRPINARPIGRHELLWRWCRRRPFFAAAILLTIILAIAGPTAAIYQATLRDRIRDLMSEDEFDIAMMASSRGKWRESVEWFDQALESGHDDPFRIHLEKIKATIALGDLQTAHDSLNALASDDVPPEHLGRLRLLEGDLLLMLSKDENGLKKVSEAIHAPLDPADLAYAHVLLANTPKESMNYLVETLNHDPFHYQGTGMIVTTLIQNGRLDEALTRAQYREFFYPDDPNFPLLQAVIYALKNDLTTAKAKLKLASGQLESWQMSSLETSMEDMSRYIGVMDYWENRNDFVERVTRLLKTIHSELGTPKSPEKNGDSETRFVAPALLRIPPVFARQNVEFRRSLEYWYKGQREQAIEGLAKLIENGGTRGEIHFMYGMFLMIENRGEADRYLAAEKAFLNAANADSMYPNLDRESYYTAAMCAAGALISQRQAMEKEDPDHVLRGILHARKRLTMGPLNKEHARNLYRLGLEAKDWALSRSILNEIRKRFPDLDEWKRHEIHLSYYEGSYFVAWQAAKNYLKDNPGDKDALSIQKKALRKIKSTIDSDEPVEK